MMKFQIEVRNEVLFSLLVGANFEYWGRYHASTTATRIRKMLSGGPAVIVEEIDENTDLVIAAYKLTRQTLSRGLKFMAAKYPNKLNEVLDSDEADMYTGEFLLQCALFGEERYA